LKITVTESERKDNELAAKVTIAAKDVNAAIEKAYKDISHKYSFQGFRKGHTPRPVIDGMVGRQTVLAQATNDLINAAEPSLLETLDVVPVSEPSYGEDPELVVEGKPYHIEAKIALRPEAELDGYDAPEIDMPPATATPAEIDQQIDQLQSYHTTYEDIDEDRPAKSGDILSVDIANVENAEQLAGSNRLLSLDGNGLPKEFDEALSGMRKGETKEITWKGEAPEGEEAPSSTVKVTLNAIKESVTPELTDEFVKTGYGFDTVDALREAIKGEIEGDKKTSLPNLKEDRVVEALAKRLKLDKVPEDYENSVFNDLAQQFLGQLQRQGMSLDSFLQARGIGADQFIADLHEQAEERARQSLALDALAKNLGIEVTKDDMKKEFEAAGVKDVKSSIQQFANEGRLPAVRESIKRTKALAWLVENAKVNEVDEVAESKEAASDDASKDAE
jgi:trigger factor